MHSAGKMQSPLMLKQAVHREITMFLLHIRYRYSQYVEKRLTRVGFEPRILVLDIPGTVSHCGHSASLCPSHPAQNNPSAGGRSPNAGHPHFVCRSEVLTAVAVKSSTF
jgi:hypothetical protein